MDILKSLNENCIDKIPTMMNFLNEDAQVNVTDQVMSEMFKFVSEKYTSLDFSEIEKSNGDFTKFKYKDLLDDNCNVLSNIYKDHDSSIYTDYINKIKIIMNTLVEKREAISTLYMQGNGMIQMFYISTVTSLVYSISSLITLTIRFVTQQDGSIEVLFEELPNVNKHVHLKNIDTAYNIITSREFDRLLSDTSKLYVKNESILIPEALLGSAIAIAAIPIIVYMSTKIIPFCREVIYTVYYSRVKYATAIDVQISLLKTNIESLEKGRGTKKIIATQKKYVVQLEKLRNFIELREDKAVIETKKNIKSDNKKLVEKAEHETDAPVKQIKSVIDSTDDLLL